MRKTIPERQRGYRQETCDSNNRRTSRLLRCFQQGVFHVKKPTHETCQYNQTSRQHEQQQNGTVQRRSKRQRESYAWTKERGHAYSQNHSSFEERHRHSIYSVSLIQQA